MPSRRGTSSAHKSLTVVLLNNKVASFTSSSGGTETRDNQVQDVPKK